MLRLNTPGKVVHSLNLELTDKIADDQQLAVAIRSGADGKDRDFKRLGNVPLYLRGYGLNKYHSCPCFLNGKGILDYQFGITGGTPLGFMAAQYAGRLGCEPNVTSDGNSGVSDGSNATGHPNATFQFDGVDIGLLQETTCISHRFFVGCLVR